MTVRVATINSTAIAPVLDERQNDFEAFYDATSSAAYRLALFITEDVSAAEAACEAAYLGYWRSHSWSARQPFNRCHSRLTAFVWQQAYNFRPLAGPGGNSSGLAVLPARRDPGHTVRAAIRDLPESDLSEAAVMYGMMGTLPDRAMAKEFAMQYLDGVYRL